MRRKERQLSKLNTIGRYHFRIFTHNFYFILNNIARLYVPPSELASGKNMTAMFKAMKRSMLRMYAQNQGYNTMQKKWKAQNTPDAVKAQQMRDYRDEKIAKWEVEGDSYFLPDFWLAFLLCSLPMQMYLPNRKLWLDCLVPPDTTVAATSMLVVVPPKVVRRGERKSVYRTGIIFS